MNPKTLTIVSTCCQCGCAGYEVDTTAGEIIENGTVVGVAPDGATLLLAGKNDGTDCAGMYCDECAKTKED